MKKILILLLFAFVADRAFPWTFGPADPDLLAKGQQEPVSWSCLRIT